MRSTVTVSAGLFVLLAVTFSLYGQGSGTKELPKEILGKTLKEWLADLKSTDPSVKVKALQAIPYFGEPAKKEAGAAMIEAVDYAYDASVRSNALMAIMATGLPDDKLSHCVEVVKTRLNKDSQGTVRVQCAVLLGQMGRDAKAAIRDLITATKDGTSYEIRKAAVTALGYVGAGDAKGNPSNTEAVHALVEIFYGASPDKSADVRLEAVMAVALMPKPGPQNHPERAHALQGLKAATLSKDKIIEIWARLGVMAHDPKGVTEEELAPIGKYLNSKENIMVRMHAVRALGTIGAKAKSQVEPLMGVLDDKELSLAAFAAVALGEMGNAAQKAVPAIEELMKKKDLDDGTKDALKEVVARINGKKPK
jgi:HEAT repeat protein